MTREDCKSDVILKAMGALFLATIKAIFLLYKHVQLATTDVTPVTNRSLLGLSSIDA